MNLFSLISNIFKPAVDLVDSLHTSEDEKLSAKAAILNTQVMFLEQALGYEQEQLKAKAAIIEAEAKSDNKLASSWRPVTMYVFLLMLVSYWFGWVDPTDRITEALLSDVFDLLKIGMGGYIASRGVEKVVPSVVKAFKKAEEV